MPTQKPQFTIVVDEETLEKIEDFRYSERYPNRSQAINYLIKKGMEAVEQEKDKDKE